MVSSTPRPHHSPGERIPITHCTGGWVGPRAGLDTEARGKIISPLLGIEPRSPGRPARSQTLRVRVFSENLVSKHPQSMLRQESYTFYVPDIDPIWPKHSHLQG
jgi:hypothetical protein